jgi:rod shape-determining protein MreD
MNTLASRRMKRRAGLYAPPVSALFFLLCTNMPLRVPHLNEAMTALLMTAIYYWGLFRSAQMPYLLVFALGLAYDVMSGLPPGLSSFAWLILRGMVHVYGRLFAIGAFWGVWAGYALSSALSMLVEWILLAYYRGHWPPALPVFQFWAAAALLYPLPHLLFSRLYKGFELDRAGLR